MLFQYKYPILYTVIILKYLVYKTNYRVIHRTNRPNNNNNNILNN